MLGEPFEKNISAFTEEFIGVFASGCFMHFNKAVAAIAGGSWLCLVQRRSFCVWCCPLSPGRGCPPCGEPRAELSIQLCPEFTFLSAGLVRLCLCQHSEGSFWRARESQAVIAVCVRSGKSYIQPTSSFGNFPAKRLGLFGKHALLKQPQSEIHPCSGVNAGSGCSWARKAFWVGETLKCFLCGKGLWPPAVPTDLQ